MKNIFSKGDCDEFINRISKLEPNSKALWGKMNVSQMLAHCNVSYEMIYDTIHPKPNVFMKFILKSLIKNKVVSDVPYSHNSKTAPQFLIKDNRNLDIEKVRLITYINKTLGLGEKEFEDKESHSFGKLTSKEWNNMLSKHLEHHLNQFGV